MDYDKLMNSFLKKEYKKSDTDNIFDKSNLYNVKKTGEDSSSEEYNKSVPRKMLKKQSSNMVTISSSDSMLGSSSLSNGDISSGENLPLKTESAEPSDASISDIEMHDMIENISKRAKSVKEQQRDIEALEKGVDISEDCTVKEDEDDTNKINLKIPPVVAKSKEPILLSIPMDQKFKVVFNKIEKDYNIKIKSKKFDGEFIKDDDTARTIDLFPDDLLDLVYE